MGSLGSQKVTPESLANTLFQSSYNKVTKEDVRNFNEYRSLLKNGKADSDITFWLIYKDGTSFVLNPLTDDYEKYKAVDMRKVAYIQIQSGDDVTDTQGLTASVNFPNDEADEQLNAYNAEIEKLYKVRR